MGWGDDDMGLLKPLALPYVDLLPQVMFLKFKLHFIYGGGMWRSEDNLWASFLSFYHVGAGDQTQATRLGDKRPELPSKATI